MRNKKPYKFKPGRHVYNDKAGKYVVCAICQKPLTRREVSALSPYHFQQTCYQHRHLRFVYDVGAWLNLCRHKQLRKKFGLKKRNH